MEGCECSGKLPLLESAEEMDVVDFVVWHRGVWFALISGGNRRNGREKGRRRHAAIVLAKQGWQEVRGCDA